MTYAQRGDRPVAKSEQDRVMLRVWTAYRCFTLGTAMRDEWADCADALNIVESLCMLEKFDVKLVMPHVVKAQAAMVNAMKCAPGPLLMTPEGLAALALVCDRYDVALFKFSENTLNQARDYFLGQLVKQAIRPDLSTLEVMA